MLIYNKKLTVTILTYSDPIKFNIRPRIFVFFFFKFSITIKFKCIDALYNCLSNAFWHF